jgi:hypothetical protein
MSAAISFPIFDGGLLLYIHIEMRYVRLFGAEVRRAYASGRELMEGRLNFYVSSAVNQL